MYRFLFQKRVQRQHVALFPSSDLKIASFFCLYLLSCLTIDIFRFVFGIYDRLVMI